jgi:SPP1 gp7 family putative phage head morphogenesis protein
MATKKRVKKKDGRIEGRKLSYNVMEQANYTREIKKLTSRMIDETTRRVLSLFGQKMSKEFFAQDETISSQSKILLSALILKFSELFDKKSKSLSKRMVKNTLKNSAISLKLSVSNFDKMTSLNIGSVSSDLKEIIKASVSENVGLIKSIQSDYLSKVNGQVMRSIVSGNGLQDLVPALKKYRGITLRKARNIAIDQTRKVYNAVNAERMKKVGINKFIWLHSGGGQNPRIEHIEMDGNEYSFDDLPVIDSRTGERGIPGQAINCGCTMKPVYDFGE